MPVNIKVGFENQPSQGARELPVVYGGIRIEINDCELTRYQNQKKLSDETRHREQYEMTWFDESGNEMSVDPYYFKGEYLMVDIGQICDSFISSVKLSPDEYREIPASIEKTGTEVVFSYIDDDQVRVAFQNRRQKQNTYRTKKESSRGYVVSKAEFCYELVSCNESVLSYLDCMKEVGDIHEPTIKEFQNEIQSTIDDLENVL